MVYNNMEDLQKQIKHIMIDMNINQQMLADKSYKTKQTISSLLKNPKRNCTLNTLKQLCDALDCDLIIEIKPREK